MWCLLNFTHTALVWCAYTAFTTSFILRTACTLLVADLMYSILRPIPSLTLVANVIADLKLTTP